MKILFGGKTNWAENNADNRAGTWSYKTEDLNNINRIIYLATLLDNNKSFEEKRSALYTYSIDQFFVGHGYVW